MSLTYLFSDRHGRVLRLIPLLLLFGLGDAAADAGIVVGPLTVEAVNGRTECIDEALLCTIALTGDRPQDMELDTSQHYYYIGLVVNDSELESMTGHELLPDDGLRVDRSNTLIRHPLFVIYTTHVGNVQGPGPLSDFGVFMNESSYGFSYYGPPVTRPTGPLAARSNPIDFSEKGVGYTSLRTIHAFGNETTDDYASFGLTFPCRTLSDPECEQANQELADELAAHTPRVKIGAGLYEIGVNEPPLPPAGIDERAMAVAPTERHVAARPLDPLGRADPPPVKLDFARGPWRESGDERPGPRPPPGQPPAIAREAFEPLHPDGRPFLAACVAAAFALAAMAAAFYSRHARREDALRSERRTTMLALLAERGPLTCAQMSAATALDRTTVIHHARILVQAEALRVRRVGRHLYLALPGQELPDARVGSSDVAVAVVRLLGEHGGVMPRAELHRALEEHPPRSRNDAIRRLVERGAVERGFRGPIEVLRISAPGAGA